jgi:hypothetical protein
VNGCTLIHVGRSAKARWKVFEWDINMRGEGKCVEAGDAIDRAMGAR